MAAFLINDTAKIVGSCGREILPAKCRYNNDEVMFLGKVAPLVTVSVSVSIHAVHDKNDATVPACR
jgi:hypothetical protein